MPDPRLRDRVGLARMARLHCTGGRAWVEPTDNDIHGLWLLDAHG